MDDDSFGVIPHVVASYLSSKMREQSERIRYSIQLQVEGQAKMISSSCYSCCKEVAQQDTRYSRPLVGVGGMSTVVGRLPEVDPSSAFQYEFVGES